VPFFFGLALCGLCVLALDLRRFFFLLNVPFDSCATG
jgi:hypothetical protein